MLCAVVEVCASAYVIALTVGLIFGIIMCLVELKKQ